MDYVKKDPYPIHILSNFERAILREDLRCEEVIGVQDGEKLGLQKVSAVDDVRGDLSAILSPLKDTLPVRILPRGIIQGKDPLSLEDLKMVFVDEVVAKDKASNLFMLIGLDDGADLNGEDFADVIVGSILVIHVI